MKVYQIVEARKNPELNPKTPINDIINSAVDKTTSKVAGTKNLFVSFTAIDKLGLNPRSKYDTPIGIYAYPAEYVKDTVGSTAPMTELPFAGEQPYVNLFSSQGNIINVATIGSAEVTALYKKIVIAYVRSAQGKSSLTNQQLADRVMQYVKDAPKKAKFRDYFGGQLWYVTWSMSNELLAELWNTKPAVAWNKLFRLIGVDGVIDYTPNGGVGIVHTAEPTQAVFFSSTSITNTSRVANSYSPDYGYRKEKIKLGKDKHATVSRVAKELKSISDPEEVYNYLKNNGFEHTRLIKSQGSLDYVLTKRPYTIAAFKNPTPHHQFVAIKSQPSAVDYINVPDEAAVIKALQLHKNPEFDAATLAMRLPNASEELQHIIVKRSSDAAQFFKASYPSVVRKLLNLFGEGSGAVPTWLRTLASEQNIKLSREISPEANAIMQQNKMLQAEIHQHQLKVSKLQSDLKLIVDAAPPGETLDFLTNYYNQEISKQKELIDQLQQQVETNSSKLEQLTNS